MAMTRLTYQHRMVPAAFRATPDGVEGRFMATVLKYNVVDSYGTLFKPKTFALSLATRMPRIVWSHDWSEPLGVYTEAIDTDTDLTLVGQLSDFAAVPRARQAWAQLNDGTIDQFSVGFMPEDGEPLMVDGIDVFAFTKGRLDEASLVIVGAVPGTELVSLRQGNRRGAVPILVRTSTVTVDVDSLAKVLSDVEDGTIDVAAALQGLIATGDEGTSAAQDAVCPDCGAPATVTRPTDDPDTVEWVCEAHVTPTENDDGSDDEDPDAAGDDEDAEADAELDAEAAAALALLDDLSV